MLGGLGKVSRCRQDVENIEVLAALTPRDALTLKRGLLPLITDPNLLGLSRLQFAMVAEFQYPNNNKTGSGMR